MSEEKVDKKYGFGFRYTNSVESIVLAASTDIDRAHWTQTIESLIQQSSHYLKAFLTILPFSTVFLNNQLKNYFGSNNKTPARKYVILTDEILSVHPDKSNLTTIDGIININDLTRLECTESNGNYIISITDSDTKSSKLSIQFNSGIDDEKYYKIWKARLQQLIYGGEVSLPVQQPPTRSSSASAAPRSSLKQAPPPPAPAPAPVAKQPIPNNVSVFGLSLDDDDEDDDVDISAVASSTTNVPFKVPAPAPIADSYPSPEAKSNASTTSATTSPTATAKRPSKPMGKSFLKMRAKSQSKERSSVTENPAPVIAEATSKSSNNPGGVTAGVFGLSLDDDDEEDNVTPSFTNPASFSNPTLTAATTAPPPPPPPSKKAEVGANESFNPITASRGRSVNQPSAALPTSNSSSESLFLQSLKSKNDVPAAASNSYDDYDNTSIGGGSNKPPPPPPPKKGVQNYEDPHSLHDFQQSNQYEQQQPQATENIFNTRKKNSLTPFGGSTNAPPVSTFNVNALDYGKVEVKPGEYEDGNITFESLRGGAGGSERRRSSVKRNGVSGGGSVNSRQISDLSLQEYLTTPIELRSSKLLDDVFAKPTEDFLHQTNQILHESKEKLKQLLQDNQSLLPHLSKTKSILQENKKSSFSLEKIEQYLQAHSIFNHYNNNGHQNSAYQQLLQEKEVILNLLQFMKLSEKNMIDTIQLYEMEALQRIENETNFYKNELKLLENEMKQLHQEHYQQIAEQTRVMELSKVLLVEKTQQANLSYQENIEQLIYLAKDLHTQQQQVNVERKKMLKQRYQLDVLLQEMNDVTYQPQQQTSHMNNSMGMSMGMNSMGSMNNLHAMNGMNNGMMNPAMPMMPMMNYSHDSMMSQQQQYAPNLNSSMNNNINMMMPNPGMNNSMMQQQQQIPLRSNNINFNNNQMMMNGNGNQSPMMMQELFNMSGGFPSQNSPNTASSFNSSNMLRGGAGSSGLPSRSVSPSGNRYMVGGNMAGSIQYNNGATSMRGTSPHGLAGVFPSTNEFPLPEETGNNNPNMLMHADEMMDYRVGRSRAVQNNNINSVGSRARSRSPSGSQSSTIQSAPQLRGGINNMSLTKQHLQLLQQQQGVGGNNGGNISRGTSPSPYYMGPPAHVNNIQVNLEQLKKHTMNNNNRKPFK